MELPSEPKKLLSQLKAANRMIRYSIVGMKRLRFFKLRILLIIRMLQDSEHPRKADSGSAH